MKKLLLIIGICSTLLYANTTENKAKAFYENKEYEKALNGYQSLLHLNHNNHSLHYNIGNTYTKLNQFGAGIIHYKMALQTKPRDKETKENLEFLRQNRLDKIEAKDITFSTLYKSLITLLSPMEWQYTMLVLWFTTLITIRFKLKPTYTLILSIATILISCLTLANYHHSFLRVHGVINEKKAAIKSGPATSLETLFFLHDGAEFKVKKEVNNWVEIELKNGFSGWALTSSVILNTSLTGK